MELHSLRYFLAVADSGSVTAAAQFLHVAQPSLSRQIRRFENELGVELFARTRGRLVLTPAGESFVPIARDLLTRADGVRAAASALAEGRLDRIRIAAPSTTLTDVIAPFIATIGPDDPFPALLEEDPANVYAALRSRADLAISTERAPEDTASTPIAIMPIWAFVPAQHPWSDRSAVTLAELGEEAVTLLLPVNYKPRQVLDRATSEANLMLRRPVEVTSPQLSQALAAAGRGVAIVSDDARFGLHGLRIQGPDGLLTLELQAAWNPRHHAAETIESLAGRLREYCATRYGSQVLPR